jgi:hypothetical protein
VATFVLINVRNNEIFCLWVSVSVDGDVGGDGYSPLGDFELNLGGGDDNYLEDDENGDDDGNNVEGGDRHNCGKHQTGKTGGPTN